MNTQTGEMGERRVRGIGMGAMQQQAALRLDGGMPEAGPVPLGQGGRPGLGTDVSGRPQQLPDIGRVPPWNPSFAATMGHNDSRCIGNLQQPTIRGLAPPPRTQEEANAFVGPAGPVPGAMPPSLIAEAIPFRMAGGPPSPPRNGAQSAFQPPNVPTGPPPNSASGPAPNVNDQQAGPFGDFARELGQSLRGSLESIFVLQSRHLQAQMDFQKSQQAIYISFIFDKLFWAFFVELQNMTSSMLEGGLTEAHFFFEK